MLTFKPIKYDPESYTSFKYIGTNSIREGQICYLAKCRLPGFQQTSQCLPIRVF